MNGFDPKLWEHLIAVGIEGIGGKGHDPRKPRGLPKRHLGEDEVAKIERKLGSDLASDYKSFLLHVGASAFIDVGIVFKDVSDRKKYHTLSILYGSHEEGGYSIDKNLDMYSGRIPAALL